MGKFMKSSSIIGHFDEVRDSYATGWCMDQKHPDRRLEVEIMCGRHIIGKGMSNVFREDLSAVEYGDGRYGFKILLSGSDRCGKRPVQARVAGTRKKLIGKHIIPDSISSGSQRLPETGPEILVKVRRRLKRVFRRQADFPGAIDIVKDGNVHGWAFDPKRPDHPLDIELVCGEELVAAGTAGSFREDLAAAGFGDGRHCFCLSLNPEICARLPLEVVAREAESKRNLDCEPYVIQPTHMSVDQIIQHGDKNVSVDILLGCLLEDPENKALATQVDKLISEKSPPHGDGLELCSESLEEFERSVRLLDLVAQKAEESGAEKSTQRRLTTDQGIAALMAELRKQGKSSDQEKSRLERRIRQLNEQNQEYLSEIEKKKKELDRSRQEGKDLLQLRDELTGKVTGLQEELDRSRQEGKDLLQLRDELTGKVTGLQEELDRSRREGKELLQLRDELTGKVAGLQEELDRSRREGKDLLQLRDELTGKVTGLQEELERSRQEGKELLQLRDELTGKVAGLQEENEKLESQNDELGYRQQLLQEEMLKAEAQIDLIKDLILHDDLV
jgi:hypothetical protein